MNITVRPPVNSRSVFYSWITLILILLGIYLVIKLIVAFKDIKSIKKNTARILDILEEKKE